MRNALLESLSLVGFWGGSIIFFIVALLVCAIGIAVGVRARYAALLRDLRRNRTSEPTFESNVLHKIATAAQASLQTYSGDVNSQAIVEANFQTHLKGLLIGERFAKTSVGLMIILGLIGTFLGLTLSIGKLVALVSQDLGTTVDAAQSLTEGLAEALAGMSVAFSTSLFGILAAIIMTFVNVFISVTDARTTLMAELENYLDNTLLSAMKAKTGQGLGMDQVVTAFRQSVSHLGEAVSRFEYSLQTFANNTRDFQEFNGHLKDNIQRMSLAFSDFGATLKGQVQAMQRRG